MPVIASLINLAHLDRLSPQVTVDGEQILLTSIYADPPSYGPIGAPGEGIACVDDVARAATVYLDEHDRTGDLHALDQARAALNFTMRMQEPDGRFTNFVTDQAGTINRTGETSRAGLGWWTFRGMGALARGYRAFASTDAAYAARLLDGYRRSETALAATLDAHGSSTVQLRGRSLPAWLDQIPPDQASVAVMALAEMQELLPSTKTREMLRQVASGVRVAVTTREREGVFGHAAEMQGTPELWHAWGAHAGEALAKAGRVLGSSDLIDAARTEVEGVLGWQLAAGRIHELTPLPVREGQQAYGVATAVRAAVELYRATGNANYARMAGLHATWFMGSNMAGKPMYDAATGRGFDGIDGPERGVNYAAGAESTIEALSALQAIAGIPEAERAAQLRSAPTGRGWTSVPAAQLRDGRTEAPLPVMRVPASASAGAPLIDVVRLEAGRRARVSVNVPSDGAYVLLSSGIRSDASLGPSATIDVTIDGAPAAVLARPGSVEGAHVSLDLARDPAVRLTRGRHEIELARTGADDGQATLLQGLVLHPAVASTTYLSPRGDGIKASFDIATGRVTLAEVPVDTRSTPSVADTGSTLAAADTGSTPFPRPTRDRPPFRGHHDPAAHGPPHARIEG